jgi:hypothetical protein
MTSLCCVTYTDNWSAGHSSYIDLELGAQHCVVGSSSNSLKNKKPGDIVIITATKDGVRHFTIVKLGERTASTLWADAGGLQWDHNFSYEPLTEIRALTPELKLVCNRLCTEAGLNPDMLMNSRFCSAKYLPVVHSLLTHLASPK